MKFENFATYSLTILSFYYEVVTVFCICNFLSNLVHSQLIFNCENLELFLFSVAYVPELLLCFLLGHR